MKWKEFLYPSWNNIILTLILFLFLPTVYVDAAERYLFPEDPAGSTDLVVLAFYRYPIEDSYNIINNIEKDESSELAEQLRLNVLKNLVISLTPLLVFSYLISNLMIYKYNKNVILNKENKKKFFKFNLKTILLIIIFIIASFFIRPLYALVSIIDWYVSGRTGARVVVRGFPFVYYFQQSGSPFYIILTGLLYDILFWYVISYFILWSYNKVKKK